MNKLILFFSCLLLLSWCGSMGGYFAAHQVLSPAEPAMHISCASMILEGAEPYIDFVDNATPLLLYLFTMPVLLSKLCYLHPVLIFNLLIVLLTIGIFSVVIFAIRQSGRKGLPVLFYLPALTVSLVICQAYFLADFGQESMVFMLLFLPYLLERYLTSTGAREPEQKPNSTLRKIIAGVLAAFGLLLNPVFLLAAPAVELICLTGLGDVTVGKLKRRYLGVELYACLAALLFTGAVIYFSAPLVVVTYLGPITSLNWLSYDYFYDNLGFVGKSPDRRDLIYAFVVFFIMALPAAGRCLLVRLMCAMSALGFIWLVCSGTVYTYQAFIMTAFAICAFCLALSRYLRSMRFTHRVARLLGRAGEQAGRLYIWQRKQPQLKTALVVALPVLCFAAVNYFSLKNVASDQYFSLVNINYYGFGLKHDLSFFSDVVEKNSEAKDLVWIFSQQARPGFPLITQLRRRPGYLVWGFPLHTLKILHERSTPAQAASLVQFEALMYDHLRSELNSVRPPKLILIEDSEIWESLKAAGICATVQDKYESLEPLSPMNGEEIERHPPFEYIGHRVSFSAFKLRR